MVKSVQLRALRALIVACGVVWFGPGEKHWHGATATKAVAHIAVQEQLDGKAVDWMEQVNDDQYHAGSH